MHEPSNTPRVFVSSTIHDFADMRSALRYWLAEMGMDVQMSEFNDFERMPEAGTFESCFEAIRASNYYVLLIGNRRGSLYSENEQISVTRQEYKVAVDCAKAGRLKPFVFVRRDVWNMVHAHLSEVPKGFPDLPAIDAFVRDIENTTIGDATTEANPGTLWIYQFDQFQEVIDALRGGMRLHASIRRQALLANLQWELEENIATLCGKQKDGSPRPHLWDLATVRDQFCISSKTPPDRYLTLPKNRANKLALFWMFMPVPDRLRSSALEEAVRSAEFLAYDQFRGCLVETAASRTMRYLLGAMHGYELVSGYVARLEDERNRFLQAVKSTSAVPVPQYDVVMLLRAHDLLDDLLRFSAALERHILAPTEEFQVPPRNPPTPYADEVANLEAEQASHEDVQRWVRERLL